MTNLLVTKSRAFALRIVQPARRPGQRAFCRPAYSRGRRQKVFAQLCVSQRDLRLNFPSIALKEASETRYWLDLLSASNYLPDSPATDSLVSDCEELLKMLTSSVKKLKEQK